MLKKINALKNTTSPSEPVVATIYHVLVLVPGLMTQGINVQQWWACNTGSLFSLYMRLHSAYSEFIPEA